MHKKKKGLVRLGIAFQENSNPTFRFKKKQITIMQGEPHDSCTQNVIYKINRLCVLVGVSARIFWEEY